MKAEYTKQIIPSLLIFLFAYTAGSKLADFSFFRAQLSLYPYISPAAPWIAIVLPSVEFLTVVLLLLPATRLQGLCASLLLLVIFTLYLFGMIISGTNLPCSCGGVIRTLSWRQHIVFNLFFIILSALGIKIQKNGKKDNKGTITLPFTIHHPE